MYEIETIGKKEAVGQLFGLFGVSDDYLDKELLRDESEEGELIETYDTFGQNSRQNAEINEEINENECIVCHSKQIKYRCPKCQSKTCSLNCCKSHKIWSDCDGIRHKLSFVKMSEYSQKEFLTGIWIVWKEVICFNRFDLQIISFSKMSTELWITVPKKGVKSLVPKWFYRKYKHLYHLFKWIVNWFALWISGCKSWSERPDFEE